jgi:pyruvate dehydrogenase E1 component beta subunit
MAELTLIEAVNHALHGAMAADDSVLVIGEDVGVDGGVFRATDGLFNEFGDKRVLDTPLAEVGIASVSVGLAAQGFKPVAEIQFSGFMYSCLDQLINHASRLRNRTRGRLTCPMVLRAPYGGGIGAPEHHSESMEALFAHIPGLRVVIPSSPQRAYGLLLAAIDNPDPVVFLEPKRVYRAIKEDVDLEGGALPLDTCFTLREGGDVTLVSWGAMVMECLAAAKTLEAEGIDCEVIDVATLNPFDAHTVLASVANTGRAVIVEEAPYHGGFGATVASSLAERGLLSLRAPVIRVAGYDTVMPLPRIEKQYMPGSERVARAVRRVMEYD